MRVKSNTPDLPPLGMPIEVASPAECVAVLERYRVERGVTKWNVGKLTGYGNSIYPTWSLGTSDTHLTTFLDTCHALGLRVILAPLED